MTDLRGEREKKPAATREVAHIARIGHYRQRRWLGEAGVYASIIILIPEPRFSATGRPVSGSPVSWSSPASAAFREEDLPSCPRAGPAEERRGVRIKRC